MKRLAFLVTLVIPLLLNSQNCLPDGITFTTQEQIDNFQTNYPGCTEIEGDVNINYSNITNLNGLNVLTSIGGDLSIAFNNLLTSLTGLEGVSSIGGDLSIYGNAALTSLVGIDNIDGGSIEDIFVSNNPQLSICDVQSICDYLSSPNGIVSIYNNASGCNNPAEIATACGFTMSCLPNGNYYFYFQADVDDFQSNFPGCTDLEGSVIIIDSNITSLNGLNTVTSIGGDLLIQDNNLLTSPTGLEGVNSIGGELMIYGNEALTSLTGLEGVNSIGGDLSIQFNNFLTSLTGLGGLTSLGGLLVIYNNYSLTNLEGIDDIDAGSIENLSVYNNAQLSICEVQSICDYLSSPNGIININNNALGCNTQEEVEEACATVSIEESSVTNLKIKPNPFTTSTTIEYELTQPETVTITFYNQFGKEVEVIEQSQQRGFNKVAWTPENLVHGVYYFRFQAGELVASGKMVLMR